MAFNIWERWPWTSFQNLNLDWLMKAMKQAVTTAAEAVTTAEEAAESVGQFDDRITNNTNAIEALAGTVSNIKEPYRVIVGSDLSARHGGNLVQGTDIYTALHEGQLPYVEYNGELYYLENWDYGNLWFFNVHVYENVDEVVLRRIHVYPQSSEVAYSIVNMAGGSSGNVFAVVVRYQNGGYVSDHTYAEILSQMQNGRIPVLLVSESNNSTFRVCGMAGTGTRTINGQTVPCIRFSDPGWLYSTSSNVGVWTIDANGVDYMASLKQLATLDNIVNMVNDGVSTNALLKTAQALTAAEQAQVKQNLGITSGGDGLFVIPVTSMTAGGVTTYSTTATFAEIMAHKPNLIVRYYNLYYTLSYSGTSDPNSWYRFIFTAQEPHPGELDTEWLYVVCENNSVTITAYSLDITGLPAVSSADNGKFLRVVNGSWAVDTVPSAETTEFGP